MKYFAYLALIGAVAATEEETPTWEACVDSEIDNGDDSVKGLRDAASELLETELEKKTSDVEDFEEEFIEAIAHLDAMKLAEKIAKVSKDSDEIEQAGEDKEAAEQAITDLIEEGDNESYNTILDNIREYQRDFNRTDKDYREALNGCHPTMITDYLTQTFKTDNDYDNLTSSQQEIIDEKHDNMKAKLTETKMLAEYETMEDAQKEMFDTILLAQLKTMTADRTEKHDRINREGKTESQWDDMSTSDKDDQKSKMSCMREMFDDRTREKEESGMGLREKAGQFRKDDDDNKLTDSQKERVNEKMGERDDRIKLHDDDLISKFNEGKEDRDRMSSDERSKKIEEEEDLNRAKSFRNQQFEDHDFDQRVKSGYFTDMDEDERGNFDEMERKNREERNSNFESMDSKYDEMRNSDKFKNMSEDEQAQFKGSYMMEMGTNMKQVMKDREEDDEMRNSSGYYGKDEAGRQEQDEAIEKRQGERAESRMPATDGESSSGCQPGEFYEGDEYMGSKDGEKMSADQKRDMEGSESGQGQWRGKMGEMMATEQGNQIKNGRCGSGSEEMMKTGMRGMAGEGGMMDKIGGVDGMMDKMKDMEAADKQQMTNMMKGMRSEGEENNRGRDGASRDERSGEKNMREEMGKMMGDRQGKMIDRGNNGKVMKDGEVEGKSGMQREMGMMRGKDSEGRNMSDRYEEKREKVMEKVGSDMNTIDRMGTSAQSNGGCGEGLCCGHTLMYGVWQDEYFCHDEMAVTHDESGTRFQCIQEAALKAALSVATVVATAFAMQ